MKTWIDTLNVYQPGLPIEEVARELGISDINNIIKVASNENEFGPSFPVLDGGKTKFTHESTILMYKKNRWILLREGTISRDQIPFLDP